MDIRENGNDIIHYIKNNIFSTSIYVISGLSSFIGIIFEHTAISENEHSTTTEKVAFYMLGFGMIGIFGNIGVLMRSEQMADEERDRAAGRELHAVLERDRAQAERDRVLRYEEVSSLDRQQILSAISENNARVEREKIQHLKSMITRMYSTHKDYDRFENLLQTHSDSKSEYISQLEDLVLYYSTVKPGNEDIRSQLRSRFL